MGTFVVLLVLLLAVAWAVRSIVKDKKSGKSVQCGCGCEHCGGHCQDMPK